MPLAVLNQEGVRVATDAEPAFIVTPIAPKAAPAYVPPTDLVIQPNPIVAPAPEGTFRGEGGTPFGFRPQLYIQPAVEPPNGGYALTYDTNMPVRDKGVVPPLPVLPGRPGEDQTMPVPTGQQPTKPAIAPAVQSVTEPGPVTGTVAGFDLSRIPFWAWLVGAAVLGSRLLR